MVTVFCNWQGWEETVIKQDQSAEGQSDMKIALPSMPSLYIISFLFRACEEIHRIGGHVLEKTIIRKFATTLLEKVFCLDIRISIVSERIGIFFSNRKQIFIWINERTKKEGGQEKPPYKRKLRQKYKK